MDSKQYRWGVGGIDSDLGIFYFIKYVELFTCYICKSAEQIPGVFFAENGISAASNKVPTGNLPTAAIGNFVSARVPP